MEHEEFEEELKALTLTHNEALYLDDSLTMMLDTSEGIVSFATMRPMASTICVPAPVDLIEKIEGNWGCEGVRAGTHKKTMKN